nr:MAG TPA: hypothetical protein [Caudoviricetes sp.]
MSVLFLFSMLPCKEYSVYLTCKRVSCCWWTLVL